MQESCAFQPLFLPGTKNVNILDTIKQNTPIVNANGIDQICSVDDLAVIMQESLTNHICVLEQNSRIFI